LQANGQDISEQKQFEIELGHARKLERSDSSPRELHMRSTRRPVRGDGVHFLKEAFEGYRDWSAIRGPWNP